MSTRSRLLFQAALVSGVVGGASAALVSRCGGRDEAEKPATSTTTPTSGTSVTGGGTAEEPARAAPRSTSPPRAAETARAPETPQPTADDPRFAMTAVDWGAASVAPDAGIPPGALALALDAGGVEDAGALDVLAEGAADASAPSSVASAPGDADARFAADYDRLFGPPSFSAGAGRFALEPSPWAASAYTPPENAGAGAFTTAPSPWAASAYTPPENAGAGPFTTERSAPGGAMLPFYPFFLPVPPPQAEGAP